MTNSIIWQSLRSYFVSKICFHFKFTKLSLMEHALTARVAGNKHISVVDDEEGDERADGGSGLGCAAAVKHPGASGRPEDGGDAQLYVAHQTHHQNPHQNLQIMHSILMKCLCIR